MTRHASPIHGRWSIVETQLWGRQALDIVVPAYIRFDRRGSGEMQLIAIGASIDYRLGQRDGGPIVEFTWAGFDEGDPTSGRAWARIEGEVLRGTLFIHLGDESAFVAARERALPRVSASGAPRQAAGVATPARRRPSRRRAPRGALDIYQFRIVLQDIAPAIWRTIQVPGHYSFWDLHVAIQDAMGWLDYHLHQFRVTPRGSGRPIHIGIPNDDAFEGEEPTQPGWEVPVATHFDRPGAAATYEYDFGDGWEHQVTLEAIVPPEKGARYPRCLAGERACPPEDCGGVGGYERLCAAMDDPSDEEYESFLEWLGRRFEPSRFSVRTVKFDDPAKRWTLAFGKARTGR